MDQGGLILASDFEDYSVGTSQAARAVLETEITEIEGAAAP
jgi:hypothetical protein